MNEPRKIKKAPKLMTLPHGEGFLQWNADRQQVELRHRINGQRFIERAVDQTAAVTKRDQRRMRMAMPDGGIGTVEAALQLWFDHHHQNGTVGTSDGYGASMRKINRSLGSKTIVDVTISDVEKMYAAWIAAGLSRGSIVKHRAVLNMAWKHALRLGLVTANVVDISEIPSGAKGARPASWLVNDEPRLMRDYLVQNGSPIATMALVMLTTGLRPGEAAALAWADVDLDARRIDVVATLARTNQGRSRIRSMTLKTMASRRSVRLPDVTVAALRRHRAAQAQTRLAATKWSDTIGLVFTDSVGGFVQDGAVKSQISHFCSEIGAAKITPNGFRHTFATVLIDNGESLPNVARMMGHSTIRMLVTTYVHPAGDLVDASSIFDNLPQRVLS